MIRLSTMHPGAVKRFEEYYNNFLLNGKLGFKWRKPAKKFNDNGLRFPIEYLNVIGKNIIMLPLEIIADYADVITVTAINNNDADFIKFNFSKNDFDIEKEYENINATSIGNLGYVALHCINEPIRQMAETILQQIFVKVKGSLLNFMNENIV